MMADYGSIGDGLGKAMLFFAVCAVVLLAAVIVLAAILVFR